MNAYVLAIHQTSCPQQYAGEVRWESTFAFTKNQRFKTVVPIHAAKFASSLQTSVCTLRPFEVTHQPNGAYP